MRTKTYLSIIFALFFISCVFADPPSSYPMKATANFSKLIITEIDKDNLKIVCTVSSNWKESAHLRVRAFYKQKGKIVRLTVMQEKSANNKLLVFSFKVNKKLKDKISVLSEWGKNGKSWVEVRAFASEDLKNYKIQQAK